MDDLMMSIVLDIIQEGFPFAATTANFGPQAWCRSHLDLKNLAYGLCCIAVFGKFNHQRGGHLILHELKVILEMRPGDIVFIPSAVVTHENIPIGAGETRQSLVFYSAGGLFRWVDAKGRSYKAWAAADPVGFKRHQDEGEERWKQGWAKYTKYSPPAS